MSEEFNLIDHYFLPLSQSLADDEVGIGDDGAVLTPPENHQLVVVTDTLVAGVHFPHDTSAYDIAWKALAVNLSDLAAMGARPGFFSLGLTLPENNHDWLKDFSEGLAELSRIYQIPLIGGDTTKGPLTVTVTAHGWVGKGRALLRSGATPGDLICVSGCLGDAGLGLKAALKTFSETQQAWFTKGMLDSSLTALNRPCPQLELGQLLKDYASAAIDVSDGLLADMGHILERSSAKKGSPVGAEIFLDQLPMSEAVQEWIAKTDDWSLPLSAGDDYQLCFTISQRKWLELSEKCASEGLNVQSIGRVTEYPGVKIKASSSDEVQAEQAERLLSAQGYQHF